MRGLLPLLAGAALLAAPASFAAQSPAAFSASVHAAAKQQRSVHYVSSSRSGRTSVTIVGDAARDHGIQRITFRIASTTGHATVIVAASVAYLRGDRFTLARFIGFKAAAATDYAGVWIRIPPTSAAYTAIAAAVTLDSAIDELGPRGTLTFVPAAPGLRAVRGTVLRGGAKVLDTVYARASSAPLPVKEVVTRPGFVASNVFSRWNRPVRMSVPQQTVPIAKVLRAAGGPSA
jgi:hypothetical protein